MSELYVVKYNVPYEGYGIAGIYDTLSEAIARAKESDLKSEYQAYASVTSYVLNEKKRWSSNAEEIWTPTVQPGQESES